MSHKLDEQSSTPKGDPEIAPDDPDDFQDVDDAVQKQVDQPRSHRKKTLPGKAKKSLGKRSHHKKEGAKRGQPKKETVDPKSVDTRSEKLKIYSRAYRERKKKKPSKLQNILVNDPPNDDVNAPDDDVNAPVPSPVQAHLNII